MTPENKAYLLIKKFHEHSYNPSPLFNTKEETSHDVDCAMICVNEVIDIAIGSHDDDMKKWWLEVKKEILETKIRRVERLDNWTKD